jgi:hypothetical protein
MKKIKEIRQRIRRWYDGKPIENDPNSMLVFIGMDRPPLAVKFDETVKWAKTHWQFLVGTAIAIIGLFLAS